MGVIKSDAYGHGLVPVAKTLTAEGVDCLGVAFLEEAVSLRKSGIETPLVVLCGVNGESEAAAVLAHKLTPVVYDLDTAAALSREAERARRSVSLYLKVDTGMCRLGIPVEHVAAAAQRLGRLSGVRVLGLLSHLAGADEASEDFTRGQIRLFRKAVRAGRAQGLALSVNHLANSAGLVSHSEAHFDMVRPGILLYGGRPSPDFRTLPDLRHSMSFRGKILQVRDVSAGTPVGYGRSYTTTAPSRIAVISTGYGDGLPRRLSNRGAVLIRGQRAPLVGRVCMNLSTCDVTGIPSAVPGDEAVFLGSQGNAAITADDMAAWCDTISYEIFCSIGRGNIRIYD